MKLSILAVLCIACAFSSTALPRYEKCDACNGVGKVEEICPKCQGAGGWNTTKRVKVKSAKARWGFHGTSACAENGFEDSIVFVPCDRCFRGLVKHGSKGTGIVKTTCQKCNGRKTIQIQKTKQQASVVQKQDDLVVTVNVEVETEKRKGSN